MSWRESDGGFVMENFDMSLSSIDSLMHPLGGIEADIEALANPEGTYCLFCLENFKKYYLLENNICVSCGRVDKDVRADKQQSLTITAINKKNTDGEMNAMAPISLTTDFSGMFEMDETKGAGQSSIYPHDRIVARSASEGIKKLNQAEARSSKYYPLLGGSGIARTTNPGVVIKPFKGIKGENKPDIKPQPFMESKSEATEL